MKPSVQNNLKNEALATESLSLRERIIEALRSIYDPEIPVNIYDLGLIYSIELKEEDEYGQAVFIQMTLTSPGCPVAETFPQMVQTRILEVKGVSSVNVELTWEPTWSKECMSEAARLQLNLF